MNWAHLHLMINHLPVIGSLLFVPLLWAIFRKNDELFKANLALFVLLALATPAVYFSGLQAEDVLAKEPGVSSLMVEHHQEAALWALAAMEVQGGVALACLVFARRRASIGAAWKAACLILALLAAAIMAQTANLGGQIRHPEARPGYQTVK